MASAPITLHVDANHFSPYAMSAYVALVEKGVAFELRTVDLDAGEHPQLLVPPGHWQRATPRDDEPTLVSCVVVPGFDFADFALHAPTD